MEDIDIVIPWVDGDDPDWRNEYEKYSLLERGDSSFVRFRDWGILRHWFRGIEKNMPWIRKIHFVTFGHLPKWLNINHPKLNIIKHSDYIPAEYLPTFNSHTIELNFHRINDLSDRFIYFNDDIFVINPVKPTRFFHNGNPCDMAVLGNLMPLDDFSNILYNNIECINRNFSKTKVIKNNVLKWINIKYRLKLLRTLMALPYPYFSSLFDPHLMNSYNKNILIEVWAKEYDVLHRTCKCRFRNSENVNQYIFRYWQIVKGDFKPSNIVRDTLTSHLEDSNMDNVVKILRNKKYSIVCLNDMPDPYISDFEKSKKNIIEVMDKIFPDKSSFEY